MIVTSPNSLFSVFLSLFPISAPVAMLARMGTTSVPLYQILASIFILLISVYVVILLSSRIFRTYLLMYGKRPKVKEIWKNIWTESRSMNKGT
ncbi:MAG TPA: ABC transporter permease, partial [Methanosarcina vacuolata]|nr:ABC transporter permease [Methanosarcina vacuolata]